MDLKPMVILAIFWNILGGRPNSITKISNLYVGKLYSRGSLVQLVLSKPQYLGRGAGGVTHMDGPGPFTHLLVGQERGPIMQQSPQFTKFPLATPALGAGATSTLRMKRQQIFRARKHRIKRKIKQTCISTKFSLLILLSTCLSTQLLKFANKK